MTRDKLVKIASLSSLLGLAGLGAAARNVALKTRNRGVSEAVAERLLEGFGKNRKAHQYFKAGKVITGLGTAGGAGLGGLGGGALGAIAGKRGAALGGLGGAGLGAVGGAGAGAITGYTGIGAIADAIRNEMHRSRVHALAQKLRVGAGAGAAGGAGLVAYKALKNKK